LTGFWDLRDNVFSSVSWSSLESGEANAENGQSTTTYNNMPAISEIKAYVINNAGAGSLTNVPIIFSPVAAPTKQPTSIPLAQFDVEVSVKVTAFLLSQRSPCSNGLTVILLLLIVSFNLL
jgi:hypothetical protein